MANKLFLELPSKAALSQLSKKELFQLVNQFIDAMKMIDH